MQILMPPTEQGLTAGPFSFMMTVRPSVGLPDTGPECGLYREMELTRCVENCWSFSECWSDRVRSSFQQRPSISRSTPLPRCYHPLLGPLKFLLSSPNHSSTYRFPQTTPNKLTHIHSRRSEVRYLEESELGNRMSAAAENKFDVLTEHLQNEE
jgi:hypothetical protein